MPATVFNETRKYNIDKETLFTNCTLALEKCGFKIKDTQSNKGLILAKAGLTLWSFGEDISVLVDTTGKITMKSNCTVWAKWENHQFYQDDDWGKNKSNIKKFFEKLEAILQEKNHFIIDNGEGHSYTTLVA